MSNPTSNFGWQMPTATDLVTDLPADFEVFGQAVDTDFADLKGGTTGQVLSKTSATDLDFTWVSPQVGDITGVTAGTGISGGGTSGTVTVTNSMATAFTTSGDLIQATGSGTFARLGTGTSGQYLTTNGTTNSWGTISAGSMTSLASGSIAASSTGFDLQSISQSYNELWLYMKGFSLDTNSVTVGIQFNNDSATNYGWQNFFIQSGTLTGNDGQTSATFMRPATASFTNCAAYIRIPNYTDTTSGKIASVLSTPNIASATTGHIQWNNASAINRITVITSSGSFDSGTYVLYGVK